jgi:hypothetical protein
MERCIVMTARRYDFNDEATGRRVEGVTLSYVVGDVEEQQDYRGRPVMSISAPGEMWSKLRALPGVYAVDFKQRPGPKGRPTLQAVGLQFLGDADFSVFDGFVSDGVELSSSGILP